MLFRPKAARKEYNNVKAKVKQRSRKGQAKAKQNYGSIESTESAKDEHRLSKS